MLKIFNLNSYSFTAKVTILLLILALLLITILFALIIPKIQEDKYSTKIKEIEKVLSISEEQIKLAGKAIVMQSELEIKAQKYYLELQLAKLKNIINLDMSFHEIKEILKKNEINNFVNFAIKYKNQTFINNEMNIYNKYKIKKYNKWEELILKRISTKDYVTNIKYFFYTKNFSKDLNITLFCKSGNLNKNHFLFEDKLKENVQNTFNLTQNLHKGKSYIFWLNSKHENEKNIPLYIKDVKKSEVKYTLSKMSNVNNIYTGDLTAKQIMNARNKKFVEHTLNNKKAISWIRDLYKKEYDGYILLLVKTVYKEDLTKEIDSSLLKILPAAIISLTLALIIGFFIFRRLFKSINILTTIAKEVNSGNKNIRSNVKGNDDIGILGIAFDSMLDSFENNIKNLDSKVEEKTKKLQDSLEEKKILLKEIHHRVKNNLAFIISLIKLQQEKIEEKKIKEALFDIQERIYAMELLHRGLYQSTNLNKINFEKYVKNIINNLLSSYKDKDVEIIIIIKDVYLNIQTAMSCGLILNELTTNAFKYAFQKGEKPKFLIKLIKKENNYSLLIKDNGPGLPKDIKIYDSNTLGLKLINSLSRIQLKGTFKYFYKEGSNFEINFQEKNKKIT